MLRYGAPTHKPHEKGPQMSSVLALTVDALKLRTLRLSRAMTQRDLARAAGISRVTVTRLEGGLPASPYSLRRIAGALGTTPDAIAKVVELS